MRSAATSSAPSWPIRSGPLNTGKNCATGWSVRWLPPLVVVDPEAVVGRAQAHDQPDNADDHVLPWEYVHAHHGRHGGLLQPHEAWEDELCDVGHDPDCRHVG